MNAIVETKKVSLITTMAHGYGMEPSSFAATVRKTCMPPNSSEEDFAAFLLVAHEHGLNPITREIYAFPKKGGGVQPIVGIDGWMTLINSHPKADGIEFDDVFDDKGELQAITCRIYRKDRNRHTSVTEYMEECRRATEPWQKWPARMLRHKAAIQCARYAFGFAGIIDPEEAERSPEVDTGEVTAPPPPAPEAKPESVDVEFTEPFDADAYMEKLTDALYAANTEEAVIEAWDALDVEATLTDNEALLQEAFDVRAARIKQFPADEPEPESVRVMRAG